MPTTIVRPQGALPALHTQDVSNGSTIFQALRERFDFESACRSVKPRRAARADGLYAMRLSDRDVRALRQAAREAIDQFGLYGMLSKEGRPESQPYESLSLTYNPQLREDGVENVHQSTLGTRRSEYDSFHEGDEVNLKERKNTYIDTYGFRKPTPAAQLPGLADFLAQFRLSQVRSRLSVLYGDTPRASEFGFGWHRDETVFENLRINIPLVASSSYAMQIEHEKARPDATSDTMTQAYLKTGYAYTFDSRKPHRVYATKRSSIVRVHLVLGFSPWFDYHAGSDSWQPNEFFGKTHPFDIVGAGALHPRLRPVD